MSKKYPRAKWTLPTTVNPSTSTGWCVPVPDDPFHKAAFLGALANLTMSNQWAHDDDHTAAQVARVWTDIIDNLEPCPMLSDVNIRLKPTDFCTIQLTLDGGATWTDVADLSDCANAAANSILDQAILDGRIGAGGQQPANGGIIEAICYDYDVTLQGNGRWLSPIPVQAGDTIEVTQVNGGWWDGNVLNSWHCPDGRTYGLGVCADVYNDEGTDPLTTAHHMVIVGNLPAATVHWFDLITGPYTVPSGELLQDLFLQANDASLSDNQGSATFHVQICKGTWIADYDFLADDGGFVTRAAHSTWAAGQGWARSSSDGGNFLLKHLNTTAFTLKSAYADYVTNAAHQGYQATGLGWNGPTYYQLEAPGTVAQSPGGRISWTGSLSGSGHTDAAIDVVSDPAASVSRWTHAHFEGTGTNPFAP